jgi:hypothetical protein
MLNHYYSLVWWCCSYCCCRESQQGLTMSIMTRDKVCCFYKILQSFTGCSGSLVVCCMLLLLLLLLEGQEYDS